MHQRKYILYIQKFIIHKLTKLILHIHNVDHVDNVDTKNFTYFFVDQSKKTLLTSLVLIEI